MVTAAEIAAGIGSVAAATYLSAKLADYIYSIVAATRSHPLILTSISTRGAINLAQAVKAHAFLDNRDHVLPEDIKEMTAPVGAHRIIMRAGHDSIDKESLLNDLLQSIPIPLS